MKDLYTVALKDAPISMTTKISSGVLWRTHSRRAVSNTLVMRLLNDKLLVMDGNKAVITAAGREFIRAGKNHLNHTVKIEWWEDYDLQLMYLHTRAADLTSAHYDKSIRVKNPRKGYLQILRTPDGYLPGQAYQVGMHIFKTPSEEDFNGDLIDFYRQDELAQYQIPTFGPADKSLTPPGTCKECGATNQELICTECGSPV